MIGLKLRSPELQRGQFCEASCTLVNFLCLGNIRDELEEVSDLLRLGGWLALRRGSRNASVWASFSHELKVIE